MKLFFRKKQMVLGYSVLRKQNTAIPQIWLIRQSGNFAEKQPDTIQQRTLTRQRYIAPGRTRLQRFGRHSQPPQKNKTQLVHFI